MTRALVGETYEHIKTGKHYKVLALAKDHKTLEEFVVYETLYDNAVSKIWIRERDNFEGMATSPDGTMHPRFQLIEKNK